jgi:heat shock protein HtpX
MVYAKAPLKPALLCQLRQVGNTYIKSGGSRLEEAKRMSEASEAATSFFVIDTEVTSAHFEDLLDFIYQQYILPRREHFARVERIASESEHILAFSVLGPEGKWYVDVKMKAGKPIQVSMTPSDETVPQTFLDQLKEDLIIGVQLFEEQVRKTTLYFAWIEGEEVIPEKHPMGSRKTLSRMFTESMLLLFIVFIGLSFFLFYILGPYTPIALIIIQLIIVLNSHKIVAKMGEWTISPKKPSVHILQYHLPMEKFKELQEKQKRETLIQMKKEIYEKTLAQGKEVDCQTANEVFLSHGFECNPENLSTKKVNVYQMVKTTAEKYDLPVPKIVISNTIMPNAAASGPSPSRGIVLITTGLLVQLEEDEILSVIGHEFSHLKGRDPLNLFALTTAEYLFRVYVLWQNYWYILYYFQFLYLMIAWSLVYFVAKFFEARADLESAIKIGQPKALAEALRKIGFRRLPYERLPSYRVQEWIGWDPHPPIYFRIKRLEKMQVPVEVKHPLVQSVKDVINGFFAAI